MNDEAWYNAFVPRPLSRTDHAQHERRQSLLPHPNDAAQNGPPLLETIVDVIEEAPQSSTTFEKTVTRRAKSYSDFYHVARAHIKKTHEGERLKRRSCDNVRAERFLVEQHEDLTDELLDSSHEKYQLYRDQLALSAQHLGALLDETSTNLVLLSSLSNSFKAVENQTSSFRVRCETLLDEQTRTMKLAEDVASNLQFYNYLEPITKRLNAPGAGHLVRGGDFPQMLANMDKCLEYMQAHPNHREAASYQARYRLLLTRALTLIRVYFTNTLRETAAEVSKRIADRQLNDTTMSTLLHAKFRVGAPELKRLGLEIQKRATPPVGAEAGAQGEYQSLMNELYQSYSAARGRLLVPLVRKKLAEIAQAQNTSKDLVAFARGTIGFMRSICLDEYDLWHQWFDGDGGIYEFLEAICEPLYDYLRPRTIHETQLQKLCDMCSLIQVRYMQNPDEDAEPADAHQLDFSGLIRPALEDAQTRLVFLTLAVLRDQIEKYKPKPEDLDYPNRTRSNSLSGSRNKEPVLSGKRDSTQLQQPMTPLTPKTPVIVDEDYTDGSDAKWRYDSGSSYHGWFPTLRKAMWLLSRIYRLVNSTVFDDLAHRIVHQTTHSLHQASLQIVTKSSAADAQLFLLKQLLILKEQIVAFDIEFVTPEVNFDFSSVTNTFWELRERGGLFNPTNLVRLVGAGLVPRVVENMLDAKVELDGRLRTVINDFTNAFASRMTESITETASKKADFNGAAAVLSVKEAVEKEVPLLRTKLGEYLEDTRTRETLVGAVEDQALQNYEEFFDRRVKQSKAQGTPVSKKGKGREDGVWDADTFANWTNTVFSVGRVGVDVATENESSSPSSSP